MGVPSSGVLPDTSAWVDYFRGRPGAGGLGVRQLLEGKGAFLCHPVHAELIPFIPESGPGSSARRDLAMLPLLDDPPDLWDRVIDYQKVLLRHGARGVVLDLMVAAVGCHHGVPVLSVDGDFLRHARFLPFRLWEPE